MSTETQGGLEGVVAATTRLSRVEGLARDLSQHGLRSRALGWTAHCLEQLREGRLIRPESAYVGPTGLRFEPLDARGRS
jgi:hypothetical protein